MAAAVVLLLAGGLAIGVVPGLATAVVPAATAFVDQAGYQAAALARSVAVPSRVLDTNWTVSGVLLGLLAAVFAVLVALTGLYVRTIPVWLRSGLHVLHRMHSGHIGDYAAWLVFGAAALAGLLALG